MKLPGSVSGATLQASLRRLSYEAERQRGSHMRITKTLSSILKCVARHHDMAVKELLRELDL